MSMLRAQAQAEWRLLALAALPIAIVIALAVQSFLVVRQELTEAALSRRSAIARLAAVTVQEKFDRLLDVGASLATRVKFRALVTEGNWTEAIKILVDVPKDLPYIERIVLSDARGVLKADVPSDPSVIGKDFSGREWFKGVSREWKPYVTNAVRRQAAPRFNVFAVILPLRNTGGEIAGTLSLQMRLDTFLDWTRDVQLGEAGFLYVVDRAGRVAFHPNIDPQADLADFSKLPAVARALKGERGILIGPDEREGAGQVTAFEPIARFGWAVIAQEPARAAFAARDQQLLRLAIAYALIVLLVASAAALAVRVVMQRRRIAERSAALEAANKDLESFSYSVSHDLRAPLRAIDGFARLLEQDHSNKLDAEARRLLGVIRENSGRMAELIDDLLAFSRLGRQTLRPERLDMAELAGAAWGELHAGEATQFRLGRLPPARGDRALLRQVWANLLSNALKYSSKRQGAAVEVSGSDDGREAVYCVSDNGAGFDMRYYDKLFGVFERLHGQHEFPGTGVGLAIVQRIVARHGGRVWVEGKVNEGARFYFSLPAGPA